MLDPFHFYLPVDPSPRSGWLCSDLPAELVPISRLHHGHDGVGDRGPDVGAHDNWHRRPDIQYLKKRKAGVL